MKRIVVDEVKRGKAEISIVGGPHPYLWIGDFNGPCFATVSDRRTLRRLAMGILDALVQSEPRRPRRSRKAGGGGR